MVSPHLGQRDPVASVAGKSLSPTLEALCDGAVKCLSETRGKAPSGVVQLSDAIESSGVPTRTAYRHLGEFDIPGRTQDVFTHVLLGYLARKIERSNRSQVVRAATLQPLLDLTGADRRPEDLTQSKIECLLAPITPTARGYLLTEMVRCGGNANICAYADDEVFRAYLIVSSASPDAVVNAERLLRFNDLYKKVATGFGFRPRDPLSWAEFTTTAAILAEGLSSDPGTSSDAAWSTFSAALLSLVHTWFVPTTPDRPFTVLPDYDVTGPVEFGVGCLNTDPERV